MTDFDVCLSPAAITNIVLEQIQEDFQFVVGDQRYKCPRILAEFLSPRVCLSHSVDPSIAEYVFETSDSNEQFQFFLSLGSASRIRVSRANLDFFLCLSREFGNSSLYISLVKHFDGQIIDFKIPDSTTLGLFDDDLIGRISSNFCRLTESELKGIPISVLFHILSNHLLKISSEDELFSYISTRICSDAEYLDLLQFVQFEYLSSDCISSFLSALPDSIDRRLWESISRRLVRPCAFEFPLTRAMSVEGIIYYLTRKDGGNVHEKGIVTVTSKAVAVDRDVRYLADLATVLAFQSTGGRREWVRWDFHKMRVRPTHYTIRSMLLKSWVVEGSLDAKAWTEIDRQTDNQDFKGGWGAASFAVSNSTECRFIRLTQTGENHVGDDSLLVSAGEFFGTLVQ
jgi:hypothetical protein